MYQTTIQNFGDAVAGANRTFKARLKDHNTVVVDSVKSFHITAGDEEIAIGSAVSSYVDVVINAQDVSLSGKELQLELGIEISGTMQYVPMGLFTVNNPKVESNKISFIAYDRLTSKCNAAYYSKLTYPVDALDVLTEIESMTGVIIDKTGLNRGIQLSQRAVVSEDDAYDDDGDEVVVTSYVNPFDGYTYKEAIGFIAGLFGKFAVCGRTGNIEFRWYTDIDYSINSSIFYSDLQETEENFVLGKIICDSSEATFTSGSGTTGIEFTNPIMTQTILDSVMNQMCGLSYTPATIRFIGDMRLDIGDIVTAVKNDGTEFKVPIISLQTSYDGGLMQTIASYGNTVEEDESNTKGPVTEMLERVSYELAFVKTLMVDNFTATNGTVKNLSGDFANFKIGEFESLKSQEANFETATAQNFSAVNGSIANLSGDFAAFKTGEFEELKAKSAELETAVIGKANVTDLEALRTRTGTLEADYSKLNTLVNGNLTSANIQNLTLTSKNTTIENGMIKNAMIENLAFDKITGIDINTTNLTVHSSDGKSKWSDNTIQISDANRVRVQIGKDASNDYSMSVWDKNGNLIWDALGATENTIQRKIIRDEVVADDANIAGSKLDIEDVIKEVNGAETVINGTRIQLDEQNQTLDMAFSALKTYAEGVNSKTETNTTAITAAQGQISTLISNTTIVKDGKTVQLKDAYNSTVSDVNSMKTTIGEHTTLINANSDDIFAVTTKANTIESDLNGTKQTVSSVQSGLNSATSRITTVESGLNGLKTRVSANETAITKKADGTTVDAISNRVTICETSLEGFEASLTATNKTVSDNYTSLNSAIAEKKNVVYHKCTSSGGVAGYFHIARCFIKATYANQPITMTITNRGKQNSSMTLIFTNDNSTDPSVAKFQKIGDAVFYIAKADTSTWDLYVQKSESYDSLAVIDFSMGSYASKFTWTWMDKTITSAISGWISATQLAGMYTIDTTSGGTSGSNSLITSGAAFGGISKVQSNLDTTNATVSTHTEQISKHDTRITATESAISLKVSTSDFNSYKTTVTGQISTAKSEAINTAASDATTKANNAKSSAISTAAADAKTKADKALADSKTYTNTQITTVNESLSTTNQEINVMKGQIALKVEQTDIDASITDVYDKFSSYSTTTQMNSAIELSKTNILSTVSSTYATKSSLQTVDGKFANYSTTTQMNSAINQSASNVLTTVEGKYTTKTDFNNLKIGGRNLLMHTAYDTIDGVNNRGNYHTVSVDTVNKHFGRNSLKIVCSTVSVSGSQDVWQKLWSSLTVGDNLILSFWIKGSVASKMWCRIGGGGADNNIENVNAGTAIGITTEWKKVTFNFGKCTLAGEAGAVEVIYGFGNSGTFWINSMKLEIGTKATDWTPAPEDTEEQIKSVKASLELKVNKDTLISEINASADVITLTGNRFIVDSDNFKLTEDGTVTANNVNLTGTFTANSGMIDDVTGETVEFNTNVGSRGIVLERKSDKTKYTSIDNSSIIIDGGNVDLSIANVYFSPRIQLKYTFNGTSYSTDIKYNSINLRANGNENIFAQSNGTIGAIRYIFSNDASTLNYITCQSYNNTYNNYYYAEGYHAFYCNGVGIAYINSDGISMGDYDIKFNLGHGIKYGSSEWILRPYTSGDYNVTALGNGNRRTVLYGSQVRLSSATGTVVSSDKRLKKDFADFDERYDKFYMNLKPQMYRMAYTKNSEEYKITNGFIAQDVEDALCNADINPAELDLISCETADKDFLNEMFEGNPPDIEKQYSLNYSGFISLNTHMIQKTRKEMLYQAGKIDLHETIIQDLQNRIYQLEKQIKELRQAVA